jgi:hypothetical protein
MDAVFDGASANRQKTMTSAQYKRRYHANLKRKAEADSPAKERGPRTADQVTAT